VASNDVRLCGVYLQVDGETGRATVMEQIIFPKFG
jgi:calcineurin-like phosphoesterase